MKGLGSGRASAGSGSLCCQRIFRLGDGGHAVGGLIPAGQPVRAELRRRDGQAQVVGVSLASRRRMSGSSYARIM